MFIDFVVKFEIALRRSEISMNNWANMWLLRSCGLIECLLYKRFVPTGPPDV